jgi:hypothetical protein
MSDVNDLVVANSGANFDLDGAPVWIFPGDVAHKDHRVVTEHPDLWQPVAVKYPVVVAPPKAAPKAAEPDDEDEDDDKPKAPVHRAPAAPPHSPARADQQRPSARQQPRRT